MAWNNRLSSWFGLSRASFLVLPRVLMVEMPNEWQDKMAELLEQYEKEFPNQPSVGTRIQLVGVTGKLMKMPDWMTNYRHPNREVIAAMKATDDAAIAAKIGEVG